MSLFSLSGRIGRVRYVLLSLGLVLGSTLPLVLAAGLLTTLARSRAGLVIALVLGLGIGLALAWSTLALQVRRCRDIGWDPWLVTGGWVALALFELLLARLAPAVALGGHQQSVELGRLASVGSGPFVEFTAFLRQWDAEAARDAYEDCEKGRVAGTGGRLSRRRLVVATTDLVR
jgi:uncharacterized membrane protein YhaH (DUF805 family)